MTKLLFTFAEAAEITDVTGLQRLHSLSSFHAHYRPLAVGDRVWKTSDTLACGGTIYLIHDNPTHIAADIERFRAWECAGMLYGLRPLREAA